MKSAGWIQPAFFVENRYVFLRKNPLRQAFSYATIEYGKSKENMVYRLTRLASCQAGYGDYGTTHYREPAIHAFLLYRFFV